MDDRKKISVITVLQRLRDERQSYVNIINKTRELIGKAQPAVPSVLIDELIDKLAENISSRRQFSGSDNSTVEIIAVPADYPDNETEFFLVDYGEPISDIKVNQSVPRIVVRIENNLEPKPRIGTVKVDYGSGNSSGFLKLKDDYYTEDGVYDTANRGRNKTNSV
ncbi:uncharacterized protein LOC123263618 [Cotesia glomerata]|nr:uncharacterized protein LOC123263618 [Cotesia glomerata]